MEPSSFLKFGLLLTVAFSTLQCSAIQCHHCKSYENIDCQDPFDPSPASFNQSSTLIDCNTLSDGRNYTFCRKTVQQATLRPDKETTRVVRACGFLEETKLPRDQGDPEALQCYRRTGTYGVDLLYCACYADGCNSSSTISVGMGFIMFFTLLACKFSNTF